MDQILPNPELLQHTGVVGYALLLCVGTGLALTVWMVRVLVATASEVQKRMATSIETIANHEATEQALLERMSAAIERMTVELQRR